MTILFTDLVDSTQLYRQRGNDAARALVDIQAQILSAEVNRSGGRVIKTIGDSVMAAFPRPPSAIECAMAMQQALQKYNRVAPPADRLYVRIGLHHGRVIADEHDLYGDAVQLATQIEEKAKSQEILTSLSTWQSAPGLDTEVEVLEASELSGRTAKTALVKVLWQESDIAARRK